LRSDPGWWEKDGFVGAEAVLSDNAELQRARLLCFFHAH
jgi:hypothetical protein